MPGYSVTIEVQKRQGRDHAGYRKNACGKWMGELKADAVFGRALGAGTSLIKKGIGEKMQVFHQANQHREQEAWYERNQILM